MGEKSLNLEVDLIRNRGRSFVALTYSGSSSPPSGLYRCVIPDSNGQSVTLYAGIYGNGRGKEVDFL